MKAILGPKLRAAVLPAIIVVAATIPLLLGSSYLLYVATLIAIYCAVAGSVTLVGDWCRELSLGHSAFFAVGAYAYALSGGDLRGGAWKGLALAILLALLGGLLFGAVLHRLSGAQFTIATVALAVIAEQVMIQWRSVSGGFGGIADVRGLSWGTWTSSRALQYGVVLCLAAVVCRGLSTLRESSWGRALVALGDDTIALESIGVSRRRALAGVMAVSGGIAAVAGWMYAPLVQYVSPDSFTLQLSIAFLIASLVGGRLPWGPPVGAAVVVGLPECFARLSDARLLIYAALIMIVVYWLPSGIASVLIGARRGRRPDRDSGAHPAATWEQRRGAAEIIFEDVEVRFSATVALAGVSGSIRRGAITCILGPNGAGKTTLLNVITGNVGVNAGRVLLDGMELHRDPAGLRAIGVLRTFQTPRVFSSLTPLENVAVGVERLQFWRSLGGLVRPAAARRQQQRVEGEAERLLRSLRFSKDPRCGLEDLAFGDLRSVELARALGCSPRILLLDEPTSGLDESERRVFVDNLRDVHKKGVTVAVITHDIELVNAIADDIMIIDAGVVVGAGRKNTAEMERQLATYSGMDAGSQC